MTAIIVPIYTIDYPDRIPDQVFDTLLVQLPRDIRQKVKNYKRWQDAYGCLFGKHLLVSAFQANGYPINLEDLKYNVYGRPYFENGPDFNISHSGNKVVCILGDHRKVGIDIEEMRHTDIDDFKDQFSSREWHMIKSARDPLITFYEYWTAKECILKADGQGINASLPDLEIGHDAAIYFEDRLWNLFCIPLSKNYACHIASEGAIAGYRLQTFPIDALGRPL
jgi:4'-phosphopantetheinyl transferase